MTGPGPDYHAWRRRMLRPFRPTDRFAEGDRVVTLHRTGDGGGTEMVSGRVIAPAKDATDRALFWLVKRDSDLGHDGESEFFVADAYVEPVSVVDQLADLEMGA